MNCQIHDFPFFGKNHIIIVVHSYLHDTNKYYARMILHDNIPFDKYNLHSSFIISYWNTLTTLLIINALVFILGLLAKWAKLKEKTGV